jgi:hypothetical protein
MNAEKPKMPDKIIKQVLSLFGAGKTYDEIQAVTQSRTSISKIKRWYNSISWAEAKIYAEENYDILKARKDYIKEKAKDISPNKSDPRLTKHFDELSEAIMALYVLQEMLSENPNSSIIRQFLPSNISRFTMDSPISGVAFIPPLYFSEHFHQEFPELNISSWTDLLPEKVIDRLRYLGSTARFDYCNGCQVCKDIIPQLTR